MHTPYSIHFILVGIVRHFTANREDAIFKTSLPHPYNF